MPEYPKGEGPPVDLLTIVSCGEGAGSGIRVAAR